MKQNYYHLIHERYQPKTIFNKISPMVIEEFNCKKTDRSENGPQKPAKGQ